MTLQDECVAELEAFLSTTDADTGLNDRSRQLVRFYSVFTHGRVHVHVYGPPFSTVCV